MLKCVHKFLCLANYLNMVVPVVMLIEDFVQFRVGGDRNILWRSDSFSHGLSGILFHLDIVKLSKNKFHLIVCRLASG